MESRFSRKKAYLIAAGSGLLIGLIMAYLEVSAIIPSLGRGKSDTGFFLGILFFIFAVFSMMKGRARINAPYGGAETRGKAGDDYRTVSDEELAKEFKKQHVIDFNPVTAFFAVAAVIQAVTAIIFS